MPSPRVPSSSPFSGSFSVNLGDLRRSLVVLAQHERSTVSHIIRRACVRELERCYRVPQPVRRSRRPRRPEPTA